jgi:UrcA family protein
MKIVTIALAALALTPVQAFAAETGSDVHVGWRDLNLNSDAGVRTLDRRLAKALRVVCNDPDAEAQLARRLSAKRCIAEVGAELASQRERVLAARSAPAILASRAR